jgi:hypothetical protein
MMPNKHECSLLEYSTIMRGGVNQYWTDLTTFFLYHDIFLQILSIYYFTIVAFNDK